MSEMSQQRNRLVNQLLGDALSEQNGRIGIIPNSVNIHSAPTVSRVAPINQNPSHEFFHPCIWCKQEVKRSKHLIVLLPECQHVYHLDCMLKTMTTHHIKGCIECEPDSEQGFLDLGDDVRIQEHIKKQKIVQGMQQGKAIRMQSYPTSSVIEHARQITEVDMNAQHSPAPLHCWIPGYDRAETVRTLLMQHSTPNQLKRGGVDPVILLNSGFTIDNILAYKYTIKEIYEMGFDWTGLIAMGIRLSHLKRADLFPVADLVRLFNVRYVDILQLEGSIHGDYSSLFMFCGMLFKKEELIELQMTDLKFLIPYGLDKKCMYNLSLKLTFVDLVALKMTGKMVRNMGMLREIDFEKMDWPKDKHYICRTLGVSSAEVIVKPTVSNEALKAVNVQPSNREMRVRASNSSEEEEEEVEDIQSEYHETFTPTDISKHTLSPLAQMITNKTVKELGQRAGGKGGKKRKT